MAWFSSGLVNKNKKSKNTLKRKLLPIAAAILPYSDSGRRAPGVDTGRFGNNSKLKNKELCKNHLKKCEKSF